MKTLWAMWKLIPLQFQICLVLLFILLALTACDQLLPEDVIAVLGWCGRQEAGCV